MREGAADKRYQLALSALRGRLSARSASRRWGLSVKGGSKEGPLAPPRSIASRFEKGEGKAVLKGIAQ